MPDRSTQRYTCWRVTPDPRDAADVAGAEGRRSGLVVERGGAGVGALAILARRQVLGDVREAKLGLLAVQRDDLADRGVELAHVVGPGVQEQPLHELRRDLDVRAARAREQRPHERRDVLLAILEGGAARRTRRRAYVRGTLV
jgi:hypothetical protein